MRTTNAVTDGPHIRLDDRRKLENQISLQTAYYHRIQRKNRLSPAGRLLGCDAVIRSVPVSEVPVRYCDGLTTRWLYESLYQNYPSMPNPTQGWLCHTRDGKAMVGYAFGYFKKYAARDKGLFVLDAICTQLQTKCPNLGVHLMHRIEKDARRQGAIVVQVKSVARAIRFYTRLGYERDQLPCAPKDNPSRLKYDAIAKRRFDYLYPLYPGSEERYAKNKARMAGRELRNDGTINLYKCLVPKRFAVKKP